MVCADRDTPSPCCQVVLGGVEERTHLLPLHSDVAYVLKQVRVETDMLQTIEVVIPAGPARQRAPTLHAVHLRADSIAVLIHGAAEAGAVRAEVVEENHILHILPLLVLSRARRTI